jgi:arginine-tRNA-protein transferase
MNASTITPDDAPTAALPGFIARAAQAIVRLAGSLGGPSRAEVRARATAEQFGLFQRYQQARHGEGDMASMGFYDFRAMVEDTPITTGMVEFRDPADRLVGACLTDWLSDGLSAVYSFFTPEATQRSLGSWAILWLIGRAQALGLPYVYLGYWVPQSRKMAYKSRYRPSEILTGGVWRMLEDRMVPAEGALLPERVG